MPAANLTERTTGQWLSTPEGTRWWFDSGSLSLDFGYASFINPADLADWLGHRFHRVEQAATDRELRDAEGLADAIARVAVARTREVSPTPEDIDVVNLYAAMPDVPPALGGGRRQAGEIGRASCRERVEVAGRAGPVRLEGDARIPGGLH